MTPAGAGAEVLSLVEEWIARLGSPVEDAGLDAWFTEWEAGGDGLIRGPARDNRVGSLQVGTSGGLLSRAYLDLATPVPARLLRDTYGEGRTMYGLDATHETVLWTLERAPGPIMVTGEVSVDGRLERIALLGY